MPDQGIDPRGPRFAAGITSALLLVATFAAFVGNSAARTRVAYVHTLPEVDEWWLPGATVAERAADVGFVLVAIAAALFLWGAASPRTAPWGVVFRRFVRPRLGPPADLEDPRPPRFAQGVGLFVTGAGLVLHLLGVPLALPIAAGAAFVAAFLNAAFGFCLGCQMYLGLQRLGVVGRAA
jgi:hypothetical protein